MRMSMDCGRRIVEMVWDDLKPNIAADRGCLSKMPSRWIWRLEVPQTRSFIWWRWPGAADFDLELNRFDEISRRVPVLANIRPSGKFLMEDFYYAGGLPALMAEMNDLLHLDCRTVNGRTLGENLDGRFDQQSGSDSAAQQPSGLQRRHSDSLRQPCPEWSCDQDLRRRPALPGTHRSRDCFSRTTRIWKHESTGTIWK